MSKDTSSKTVRHEFIDTKTKEDVFDSVKNKYIHISNRIPKEIKECVNKDFIPDPDSLELLEQYEEITESPLYDYGWHISTWTDITIWFANGFSYVLSSEFLKSGKKYIFNNSYMNPKFRKYVYEVIIPEDMNIMDRNKYDEAIKNKTPFTYKQVSKAFDGEIIEQENGNEIGVLWRYRPGFKLRLLYTVKKVEVFDGSLNIGRFHLVPNTPGTKNYVPDVTCM